MTNRKRNHYDGKDGSIILTANHETKVYGRNETFAILPYTPHSNTAHSHYTMLSLCIDKIIIRSHSLKTIRDNLTLLLMQTRNTGKINQTQILQLLNRLNENVDFTNWHTEKRNPYIHTLKEQLETYPECKLTVEEMAQNAFTSKCHFIRSFKAEVDAITEVALTSGFCDQSH